MKKLFAILAFTILLVPGFVLAQCFQDGDPCIYYGWDFLPQPSGALPPAGYTNVKYGTTYAGYIDERAVICAGNAYDITGCNGQDTFCCEAWSSGGWTLTATPPFGTPTILDAYDPGINWYWVQEINIETPCDAMMGHLDTIIVAMYYVDVNDSCNAGCGDCLDPVITSSGRRFFQHDTLVLEVVAAPPSLGVYQDTLTLVARGQTQAYIPFSVCNGDPCAPPGTVYYTITSTGHIPMTVPATSVVVSGGECKDVYGVLDAGSAIICTYDTLTIVAWTGSGEEVVYDTCVQVVHVVEDQPVPLFTVPVVTILVLALILAAAVFMRRRAAARA